MSYRFLLFPFILLLAGCASSTQKGTSTRAAPSPSPMAVLPDHGDGTGASGWFLTTSGCLVWNARPRYNESASWSGDCLHGIAEGGGILQWYRDGRLTQQWEGPLIAGNLNGYGTFNYFEIDAMYAGTMKDGKEHGFGTLTFLGTSYTGEFKEGKMHGIGAMHDDKGTVLQSGLYEDNEFVGPDGPASKFKSPEEAFSYLQTLPAWLPSIDRCPTDSMPQKWDRNYSSEKLCAGDRFMGCVDRCQLNDSQACFWLGHALTVSRPGEPERLAQSLFLKSCELGEPAGCTNFGAGRLTTQQHVIDDCTVQTFRRTCDADDAWGCAMLARVLTGVGNKEEMQRAGDKACSLSPHSSPCASVKQDRQAAETLKEPTK